jgi:isopentenyl phosphate kinase
MRRVKSTYIFVVLTWMGLRFSVLAWIVEIAPSSDPSPFDLDDAKTTSLPWLQDVVLIKVGGSSITDKAVPESLNQDSLSWFARSLAAQVHEFYLTSNATTHITDARTTCPIHNENRGSAFIVVHGAGSFGHHTAKQYDLKGQTQPPRAEDASSTCILDPQQRRNDMQGIAHTRRSVRVLNHHVVSTLIEHNIAAVGISPCFGIPGMQAHGGSWETILQLQQLIQETLQAGLIPVLHGDACLYGPSGAGILSGDTVMELLAAPTIQQKDDIALNVPRAIFLTDTHGVYTKDPNMYPDTAELLTRIAVNATDGTLLLAGELEAEGSRHDHDVTGGLKVGARQYGERSAMLFIKIVSSFLLPLLLFICNNRPSWHQRRPLQPLELM